jgi:2-polyprenyl-3-methyl-5-hydroxy-6-metoxy-1,4-benzoquinol methylase
MIDPTGRSTMSPAMAEMRAYPAYLFRKIERFLGNGVLEIGVGHGTYTEMLLARGCHVRATDIDPDCVAEARRRFAANPRFSAGSIDLTHPESVRAHADFEADSLLCLNVLEHIEDHQSALIALRECSIAGARLAVIVPAHQSLYGKMDAEAGHYRRYSRKQLRQVMEASGWRVERCRYLNFVGMLGWFYHNRMRKDAGLGDESVNHQMRWMDAWLPRFAKLTDPLLGRLCGLSVLAIGQSV